MIYKDATLGGTHSSCKKEKKRKGLFENVFQLDESALRKLLASDHWQLPNVQDTAYLQGFLEAHLERVKKIRSKGAIYERKYWRLKSQIAELELEKVQELQKMAEEREGRLKIDAAFTPVRIIFKFTVDDHLMTYHFGYRRGSPLRTNIPKGPGSLLDVNIGNQSYPHGLTILSFLCGHEDRIRTLTLYSDDILDAICPSGTSVELSALQKVIIQSSSVSIPTLLNAATTYYGPIHLLQRLRRPDKVEQIQICYEDDHNEFGAKIGPSPTNLIHLKSLTIFKVFINEATRLSEIFRLLRLPSLILLDVSGYRLQDPVLSPGIRDMIQMPQPPLQQLFFQGISGMPDEDLQGIFQPLALLRLLSIKGGALDTHILSRLSGDTGTLFCPTLEALNVSRSKVDAAELVRMVKNRRSFQADTFELKSVYAYEIEFTTPLKRKLPHFRKKDVNIHYGEDQSWY
ncbi:hypothetical protein M422DRAFT_50083 [Sphaerobolus stellatus SS14]|uniref:Uncharacterized protein n=1 Tax=Sphaerobolus stellatus (strain SS14) TaxID=990650 RepID=A0A0C9VLH6_SPHS4|nr:hypothetical protein M422DRAFT_50083 [Sphaerobolus stellatus SS14]